MKKQLITLAVMAFTLVAGPAAAADWSTMTGGIDFSGEAAGIIAIVGLLATLLVTRKGGRTLLGMIK